MTHRSKFHLCVALSMTFAAGFALIAGPVLAMGPDASFKPSSGPKGSSFSLTAMAFKPGERVLVDWDHPAQKLATIVANDNGELSATLTVPVDATEGLHKVTLAGELGSAVVDLFVVGEVAVDGSPGPTPTGAPEASSSDSSAVLTPSALLFGISGLLLGFGLGAILARRPRKPAP
ncbi:MAG: hypothetical protein ABR507_10010 [Actinomycetota bacterium]